MLLFTAQQLQEHLKSNRCEERSLTTSAGNLIIRQTAAGIIAAEFRDGASSSASVPITRSAPLIVTGTDFQIKVWQATMKIPAGTVITYSELAQRIGKPRAVRAVANALGANKIAYLIPCHRVVRKNGELGGYRWGLDIKKKLLEAEVENCLG